MDIKQFALLELPPVPNVWVQRNRGLVIPLRN